MPFAKTTIVGNITADPVIEKGKSGNSYCRFTLAVNNFRDEEASFIPCVAFGKTADVMGYIAKGNQVTLAGRLKQGNWETAAGERKSRLVVIVEELVLPSRAEGSQPPRKPAASPSKQSYRGYDNSTHEDEDDIPF